MPCYTKRQVTVELLAADRTIMIDGLKAAGFTVTDSPSRIVARKQGFTASLHDGRITVEQGQESMINQVKRAYSTQVVKVAAKRFGWSLTASKESANVVLASRRF